MHRTRKTIALLSAASCAAALMTIAGCSKSEETSTGKADTTSTAAWVLTGAPAGEAVSVADAKASAAEGDAITIRARIGGRSKPITADSPVFLVMDMEVPSCADMEEDHCATPWDYCCEAQESIKANSATVQIVGPDGSTIETDPIAAGLNPLDEVIVVGTVGPRPNSDVLTIRATGIHRVGG
ncbi:MAG: hypothetical protein HND58_15730 [Planctomycetota bacterium]|nr:MAG: hypothetical protein HND58_15730 [Planctomycetota bacterium]